MLLNSAASFIPHGYCLAWSPMLIGLISGAHLLIGFSYMSIPVALFFFARRHPELDQKLLFGLFSAFILGCGATHLIELVNIWVPMYRLDSLVLAATAIVSVVTAALIWPLTAQASKAIRDVNQSRIDQAQITQELFNKVAELREVNAKLDESERRFRMSVEYAPNGQAIVSLDGRWLMVNQGLCKILEYSEAELLQTTFQQITHPDDLERDLQHVEQLLEGRAVSYRMDKRYFRKSGQIVYAQLDVALLRSPDNTPLHFIVQIQDITARRNAEIADELVERRFRRMIEDVSDYAIINLDPQGMVASWNEGARRIKGYAAGEVLGKHFSCFYPQEDIDAGRPGEVLEIAKQRQRFTQEGWRVRKDGSRFWASVLLTAIYDTDGVLIGFSKITRDLTERRNAEKVLAQANRLREAIMNAAPYSIIATDPNGIITSMNPAAERMLWYAREDLIGKVPLQVLHDQSEIATRAKQLSKKYSQTIEPSFDVFVHEPKSGLVEEQEWTYVRKDGSRFPVQLAVSALRGADQEIIGFLNIAYDITQRKRREEYTRHISLHDELTGLPNRTLLYDRLNVAIESANRSKKKVGVMMLDLDHFKRVNDTLGHHVGDELLKIVSDRISKALRGSDTAARMGGDEFVIVAPDIWSSESADMIAEKLIKAVSEPMTISQHELVITPSIGVSCYPDDGDETNLLLKNADAAMYQAKAAGRFNHAHFNADMQDVARRKVQLEASLRRAIVNNEIQVHYQPQYSLETGCVIGFEALARWIDPVKGMIAPELFIPIAEESGLIIELGNQVLRHACRDVRILSARAGYPLTVAVNFSARQFSEKTLRRSIQSALDEFALDPKYLELEITESALMATDERTRFEIQSLRDMGMSIAVDDFGTGYSSLSYLTKFPISTLKIDRSFVEKMVAGERDAVVVRAIIAMAISLKTKVVAEGVETLEQVQFLQQHSCAAAQGFYMGHPMSLDKIDSPDYPFCRPLHLDELSAQRQKIRSI